MSRANPAITHQQLGAIAAKHGLAAPEALPVPWIGAASHVYPLADVVVKVPFDRPDTIEAVTIDAAIAPVARELGVSAPEHIAFDDSGDILPVPFAIIRRVAGVPLDRNDRSANAAGVWEEAGRQIARVHTVTEPSAVPLKLRTFRQTPEVDPRPWVDELRRSGHLGAGDDHWLRALLDRLAPDALAEAPLTLCHGDVNAANILVDGRAGAFRALIDWAGAGWLDPAWDFAGVPLDAVPSMLAGHRTVAPLPGDATAETRICWCQVQTRLYSARSTPPNERPVVDVDQIRRFANRIGVDD